MNQPTNQMPKEFAVSFSAEVNPHTSEALLGLCADLANKGVERVHLLLSSPGGGVTNGINVYNVLRGLPFHVVTHNVGAVDSIANVIFLAGDTRYACPNSSFMFHGVGFDIKSARLEEKVLKERLGGLRNDQKLIGDIIVRHTKITQSEVEKLFFEAAFVSAADAKGRGIVDDVIDIKVPKGVPFLQLVFQR